MTEQESVYTCFECGGDPRIEQLGDGWAVWCPTCEDEPCEHRDSKRAAINEWDLCQDEAADERENTELANWLSDIEYHAAEGRVVRDALVGYRSAMRGAR